MAPSIPLQKAIAAIKAMMLIGFDEQVAKAALRKLLKIYKYKWESIEAENYRLLADAILDNDKSKSPEASKKDKTVVDEPEKSLKRPRHMEDPGPSQSTIEPEAYGETSLKKKTMVASDEKSLTNLKGQMIKPMEVQCETGTFLSSDSLLKNGTAGNGDMASLLENGQLGLKHHRNEQYLRDKEDKPMNVACNNASANYDASIAVPAPSGIPSMIADGETQDSMQMAPDKGNNKIFFKVLAQNELGNARETVSNTVNVACSNMAMSAADLAPESCDPQQNVVRSSSVQETPQSSRSHGIHRRIIPRPFYGSRISLETSKKCVKGLESSLHINGDSNASSPKHDENDIAKGEERIRISIINEFTSKKTPSYFHYIPGNVVYQNALVNFSLARIDKDNCCINCFGNCLTSAIPCACARETGDKFVYTVDGLLKKEFLYECISMKCYSDKRYHVYCKSCPIEKVKRKDMPDSCKGHLLKKFIKECWSKCGCSKQCGNRVVQRGITRNLQVFYTGDGRGWGLRTLEEIPRGAFVCEFVGEILTSREIYHHARHKYRSAKHTFPLFLDAAWDPEKSLKDEEALCLDASFYGNVGRFINHRCFCANLIDVPVKWETPDGHYYHLAYFTTRKVEAFEELTRDYGIDFKGGAKVIKAFNCLCGSRFCRDRSRGRKYFKF